MPSVKDMTLCVSGFRYADIEQAGCGKVEGGLIAYSTDLVDQSRRAASYVDRLLRGAKVAELPVQFPIKYQLVVNMKTVKTIGLTMPEAFLLHADELIE
jgi:putative ABC transport system substrate-binding protein